MDESISVGGPAGGTSGGQTRGTPKQGGIRSRIAGFFAYLGLLLNIGGSQSGERSEVQGNVQREREEEMQVNRGVRRHRFRRGAKKTRHRRLVRIRRRKRLIVKDEVT